MFCCLAQEGGTLASPSKVMGMLKSLVPVPRRGRGQSWDAGAHGPETMLPDLSVCTKGQGSGECDRSPEQEEAGGKGSDWIEGRQ